MMTKTHVLLRNRKDSFHNTKQNGKQILTKNTKRSTQTMKRSFNKSERERSKSPNYNEPPKLEIMASLDDDEDINSSYEYPSVLLSNDEYLRPGRTIINCPCDECDIKSSKVIEIVSHFRDNHRKESDDNQTSINLFTCPLCSSTRFEAETASSNLSILQEHTVRYHGRSLTRNDFPLLCSILINTQQPKRNSEKNTLPNRKKNFVKQTSADENLDNYPHDEFNQKGSSKAGSISTHSAAMTLASLQQIMEKPHESEKKAKVYDNEFKPPKTPSRKKNSLEALSKVAHFNNIINAPKPTQNISEFKDNKKVELNNISGLHTLALLSMQNHDALENSKSSTNNSPPSINETKMVSSNNNVQRQILPKITQVKVQTSTSLTIPVNSSTNKSCTKSETLDPGSSKGNKIIPGLQHSKEANNTLKGYNQNANTTQQFNKRPLPPLAIKPATSQTSQTRNNSSGVMHSAVAPSAKMAKLAIPPLSINSSTHPKLILPANVVSSTSLSSTPASVSGNPAKALPKQQNTNQKIIVANTAQLTNKTLNSVSSIVNNPDTSNNSNLISTSQSLQDSIASNKNLTALMLQIQNPQQPQSNSITTNNSNPTPLAIISGSSTMKMPIVSTVNTPFVGPVFTSNLEEDNALIRNSPIRLMINPETSVKANSNNSSPEIKKNPDLMKHLAVVKPSGIVTNSPSIIASNNTSMTAISTTNNSESIKIPFENANLLDNIQKKSQPRNNVSIKMNAASVISNQRSQKSQAQQLLKQPLLKILPKPTKGSNQVTESVLKQTNNNISSKKTNSESILVKVDNSSAKGPRASSLRSNHTKNSNNLKNITPIH